MERVEVATDDVDVELELRRWGDEYDVTRGLRGRIVDYGSGPETIELGGFAGLVSRRPYDPNLWNAGDSLDGDSAALAEAAIAILDELDREVEVLFMLEHLVVKPQYRGNGLTGRVIEDALEVLQCPEALALVVVIPSHCRRTGPCW